MSAKTNDKKNPKHFGTICLIVIFVVQLARTIAAASGAEVSTPLSTITPSVAPALPSPAPAVATPAPTQNIYQQTLKSTVLILVTRPNVDGFGTGTGWIVDQDQRLIVTNDHVVEGAIEIKLLFPKHRDGMLLSDESDYDVDEAISGRVLDSDASTDLAMIQADSLPSGTQPLTLADRYVSPGERIHTIAGMPDGSSGLWVYGTGTVRLVSKGTLANGGVTVVLESDIPVNGGNSGAAVVDDAGQLVAVVEGYRKDARGLSLFVGLPTVKEYLGTVMRLLGEKTAQAYFELGSRHRAAGRLQEALRLFNEALKVAPRHAAALAERGWTFLSMNDPQTARGDFDAALQIESDNARALLGRAKVALAGGDTETAIRDLTDAIRSNPNSAELYNERGVAHFAREEFRVAETNFYRAIDINPNNSVFFENRGITRRALGRMAESIEDLVRAFQLDPTSHSAANELGVSLYNTGKYAEAAEAFKAAIELYAGEAVYFTNLGGSLREMKESEAAVKILLTAIEMNPQDVTAYHRLSLALYDMQKFEEAAGAISKAIELNPNNAELYNDLSVMLGELGQTQAAQAAYAKANQLNPGAYPLYNNANTGNSGHANNNHNTNNTPAANFALAGQWYCDQMVNGFRIQIATVVDGYGNWASEQTVTDSRGWTEETTEAGQMTIQGATVIVVSGGERNTYPFQFVNDRFSMQVDGVWLTWQRVK